MNYWLFGSMAMWFVGRQWRKAWAEPVQNTLVLNQRQDGCAMGSWDPVGAWGSAGGRVYATAVNVLTLETPYRVEIPKLR